MGAGEPVKRLPHAPGGHPSHPNSQGLALENNLPRVSLDLRMFFSGNDFGNILLKRSQNLGEIWHAKNNNRRKLYVCAGDFGENPARWTYLRSGRKQGLHGFASS